MFLISRSSQRVSSPLPGRPIEQLPVRAAVIGIHLEKFACCIAIALATPVTAVSLPQLLRRGDARDHICCLALACLSRCLVVFVVRFLEVVQKNVERSDDCSLKDCGRRPQIQSRQNRHLIGG